MTNEELYEVLLEEHLREKKITIRNIIIVAVLVVALLSFLMAKGWLFTMLGSVGAQSKNYIYVMIAVALGLLTYPYIVYRRSMKVRPQLDKLKEDLAQGKSARALAQETIYKTTIPILRINLKLNPFEYLSFNIENNNYFIPVPAHLITDVKTKLSAVSVEEVADVWMEMNVIDDQSAETTTTDPLKPLDAFQEFAKEELLADATASNKSRKSTKKFTFTAVGVVILLMGSLVYFLYQKSSNDAKVLDNGTAEAANQYAESINNTTIYTFVGFAIICVVCYFYFSLMRKRANNGEPATDFMGFKVRAIQKILKFINPTFLYAQHSHISLADVIDTDMFVDRNYKLTGNDLMSGRHSGVPFQYCDLSMTYRPNFSSEKEGDDVVFAGQYFVTKFNKRFSTPLFLYSKSSLTGFFTNNSIHTYVKTPGSKVKLEDPEFDKLFDVYCEDQVAARYILSTSLMERIKNLSKRTQKGKYFMAFHNNKVSVLNNTGMDAFETGLSTQIDAALLDSFYMDICDQLSIIDELKLNINIWSK